MHRAYAFQISPRRTGRSGGLQLEKRKQEATHPILGAQGGRLEPNEELWSVFSDLAGSSKLEGASLVHLLSEDEPIEPFRNVLREHLLRLAYGDDQSALESAQEIALKLSMSMDQRSAKHSLLVIVVEPSGNVQRTTLWLFPQDDVFRLDVRGRSSKLSLLGDVFSKSSVWRKAAMFSGSDQASGFRTGRVIDLQNRKSDDRAADFWLKLFLNATYALDPKNATAQLTGYLKDAFECSEGSQREQLYATIVALPRSPKKSWTFEQIAEQFLDNQNQEVFLNLIPESVRSSSFQIDRDLFESKLQVRVFETIEGVWISAPGEQIGKSVKLDSKLGRIRFEGTVKRQSIKSRHVK
jgi:hypothetical protein